jgi:DNA invertase Pin-like site-specific DNA recombinase
VTSAPAGLKFKAPKSSSVKAEGKYKGRKPTARARADEVRELHAAGVGATEIAAQLEIGRASVYRALHEVAKAV